MGFIILQGFKIVHYQRPKSIVTELNVRNLNLSFQNLLQYFRSIGFKVNKFSKEYLVIYENKDHIDENKDVSISN